MKRRIDTQGGGERAKRRAVDLESTLDRQDTRVFRELKRINKDHPLWTYFTRPKQAAFGAALNFINLSTFESLKETLIKAIETYRRANRIAKSNATRVLDRYEPSKTETGKLVVMFMNIGSGDCIFIKTPKGKTIVVDCGQRSSPENREEYLKEIKDMLTSPLFLGGRRKTLYALILTHPDKDHYNEVKRILDPSVSDVLHAFYTSDKQGYSERRADTFLNHSQVLNKVTINSSTVQIKTSEEKGWERIYSRIADKRMIQILGHDPDKKNWDEDTCNIYLLAAGVPPKYADTKQNAGSIVTLIEAHNRFEKEHDPNNTFSRKVLLCGDATYSTEDFLLKEHKDLISNVDLMQLEHHGSGTEHAGDEFVKTVNPVLAVASSGPHDSDRNPRWSTIEAFVDRTDIRMCKEMDSHKLKYAQFGRWTDMNNNTWSEQFLTYGLFTTESNNDLCFIIDKDGNLIRKFSRDGSTHTYTISRQGKRTVTLEPIKK